MILGLGLWILPAIVPDYPKSLLSGGQIAMMATFLSNLAFALGAPLGSLSHLWSIGSEEQFYLLWPLLLRWVRRTWVAILAVAALWLVAMGAILLIIGRLEPTPVMKTAFRYIHFIRFECMAMGAAAALVLQRGHRLRTALLDLRTLIVACGIGLLTLIFWPLTTLAAVGFRELPLSFAFAVIVAQVADGRGRRLFELAPFRFLGQISYGLYMYHPLVIAIAAPRFFQGTSAAQAPFAFPWPYVLTVIAATISVATVSYGLIERPILGRAGSSRWLIDMKAGATSQESYPAKVQP
jgi:peptidoglycan/LPS O-acetylase OafA/YrhL